MKKTILILLMTAMAAVACENVDKNRDALEGQNNGTLQGTGHESETIHRDSTHRDSVR